MPKALLPLLLLASIRLSAAGPEREIFPSDYKPAPCAPDSVCASFKRPDFSQAAQNFLLLSLDAQWADDHYDKLLSMIQPYCAKLATCQGSNGRARWFCNDLFLQELHGACDKSFTEASGNRFDHDQCMMFVSTYALGVDQQSKAPWEAAQSCAAKAEAGKPHRMEWWTVPAVVPSDYAGTIRIFAIDSDTHVPVQAQIDIEDQSVFTGDSPTGRPTTFYGFKWPRKLVRVANAAGHTDVRPPNVTLTAPGYDTVVVSMPTPVPAMRVSAAPAIQQLRPGTHTVTITATDAQTGKPVEAQVMVGDSTAGFTNQPLKLTIRRGSRPEVWLRSPFNAYSDVVVAPARK